MAEQHPTIIVGHLKDDELKQSINALVAHFQNKLQEMVTSTNTAVDTIQRKLKSIGDTKIEFPKTKGGASGDTSGSTERTRAQKTEKQSVDSVRESYDALLVALKNAQRQTAIYAGKNWMTLSREDTDKYAAALKEIDELNEKLRAKRGELAMAMARANEKSFGFDARTLVKGFDVVDERLSKLNRWYSVLEKQSQKQIESARKAELKFQNDALKAEFTKVFKLPQGTFEEIEKKIRRITTILSTTRELGILSPTQTAKAETTIADLRVQLEKTKSTAQETSQAMQKVVQPHSARDSYLAFLQGFKQQMNSISQQIKTEEAKFVTNISTTIENAKREIRELNAEIMNLRKTQPSGYRDVIKERMASIEILKNQIKTLTPYLERAKKGNLSSGWSPELESLYKQLAKVTAQYDELTKKQQGSAQASRQQAQEAKRNADEVTVAQAKTVDEVVEHKKRVQELAAEVRKMHTDQKRVFSTSLDAGFLTKTNIYPENDARAKGLTIEQQIEAAIKKENEYLQQSAAERTKDNEEARKQLDTERQINQEVEKRKRYKEPKIFTGDSAYQKLLGNALGIDANEVKKIDANADSITRLTKTISMLEKAYKNLGYVGRNSPFGKQILYDLNTARQNLRSLQQEMSRPMSLKLVLGFKPQTLDDIAYKISQLQAYKRGINITDPKQAQEIKTVDAEIKRLQKDLDSYMVTTRKASEINQALSRSWNYMKNRLAFYFTVGASTQFLRNLIEIRSQYEMNERALGILIGSAERGTQIFNELSQMSLVSPYTLIELSAAAEQLTAYDVEARNVVDTTRRLADMAAAVGIPIERLTYAIGQVKAFGYLNSRDARMFSNAGIPLVKQLSEYYTELEGKMVSTADIYDRIKKKAIGYNEVMQVMYKMTDEGGKFYDFQAKMADTLKVRLANFTLAWNNMLNDIGKSSQGFLVGGINGLTKLLRHWKDLEKIIYAVAGAYGGYKAMQILVARTVGVTARSIQMQVLAEKQHQATLLKKQALYRSLTGEETKLIMTSRTLTAADYQNILATKNMTKQKAMLLLALNKNNTELKKALIEMGLLTKAEAQNIAFSKVLSLAWKSLWISLKATAATVASLIASNWWMILIAGAASAAMAFKDASDNVKQFNDAVRSGAEENKKNIAEYLKSMEKLRSQLTTKDENGRVVNTDISDSEAKKAWESMREQIELSSAASASFVGQLMRIGNVSERLRQGFRLLDDLQKVNSALSEMDEKTLNVTQDYSKWWNLWQAPDGLIDNIKDYNNVLKDVRETWGSVGKASKEASDAAADDLARLTRDSTRLAKDVAKLADSINMFNANNSLTSPEQIQESYAQTIQKIINENGLSPDDAYALQVAVEEKRGEAIKEALEVRYKDELKALENVEDDKTRFALIKAIERDDAMLDYYRTTTATERAEWERFTEYLKDNHIHEMQAMFQNMDEEQLKSINWQEGKYQDFIKRSVESYAKRHKMSYDEAFDHLRKLVNNANMWEIFINLHIVAGEEKPWIDQLKEADSNLESAVTNMDRLKKTQKEIQDELRSGNPTLARRIKLNTALAKTTAAIAAEEANAAEARDKFGISKTEEKAAAKAAKDAEKERKKQQRDALKHQREEESELQRTLKNELTLIDKIRGVYKELTKDGMSHAHAIQVATKGYEKTEQSINAVLSKWGLGQFRARDYAGITNPNELLRKLKAQLERINATGRAKPAEIKDFEVKIKELVVDAEKYNLTKITKGLNTELDKLKDEYELAVEIDANPELGNAFAEMFGINVDELPHTFAELFERANKVIKDNVRKLGVDVLDLDGFDILRTPLKPENGKWNGIDSDSSAFQELTKWQNTFREMFKKNMTETENMLDEYVKKYGDFSDKIAEIESDRLDKIRKLNEAYFTEEMRKRPDYLSKLNAIEQGSQREKGNAAFEEFKNSRLYVEMFENLEYVSTATLEAMREKLENLKSELGSLSPEQLKSVIQQFEKIDNELISRNPFKGLIKGAKDYAKAVGKQGKKAQEDFRVAQRKYDFELGTLATMKEQLEQVKAEHPMQEERIKQLEEEIAEQEGIVAKRREELEIAAELNKQYNLMRQLFGQQAQAIGKVLQVVASNLQSLAELRDTLKESFGVELGANIDATIDGLTKVGNGINQIVSSAQGGNVVGVVTGTVNTVYGIGDAVASIFGKGSAKTKKLNKQIEKSAKTVTELNNAYKALERSVDKSLGKAETEARRLAIANKEAELAELQRQLTLEKRKRKKDEDSDAIADYESRIQDLKYEIEDLNDTLVSELLGSDIKSAAEGFVDAWVGAWREGETTLDAIEQKMDEMIMNLIKKAATSAIVSKILKPLYDAVDQYTSEASEGGVEMTQNEIAALAALSKQLGVDIDVALGAYYKNLERIGAVSQTVDESKSLSALQAGIQGITEETAGALEAYMNSVSQQVYLHSDLLTQIRDAVVAFDLDVSTATISQILLQLQSSYQVQMSINNILSGVLTPNGRSFSVELAS